MQDFPPILLDFSLEKIRYLPKKTWWNVDVFFLGKQLWRGILAYSYARVYVGTRTSPRTLQPKQAPASHLAPARQPEPPSLRPSGPVPATEFSHYRFFSWAHRIFFQGTGKKIVTKGKDSLTALKRPCPPRSAARCSQKSCWAAAFCMYTMLHKSLQLSQILMLTLTMTPSRGSFGLFCIVSSRCYCISAAAWVRQSAGAKEWVQWLERGSMNPAQIECNCVNENIAIAQRWWRAYSMCLQKCPSQLSRLWAMLDYGGCLNIEALEYWGDAWILRHFCSKFIGPIHARK